MTTSNPGSTFSNDGSKLPLVSKTAVVTGASRGIGRAIAEAFAAAGARVALCSRASDAVGKQRLADAAHDIERRFGAPVLSLPCDVARMQDVEALHAVVSRTFGVPDVVCNNAGTVVRARLDELGEADWDGVIGANLKGTFNVTRVFLPEMRARASGRIINIASISGRQGTARLTAYCAAKHGVIGLTRALAEETRAAGIQVNAICPGSVDTDMLTGSGFSPRMAPSAIANVAVYLAAHAPDALTGACIDVFG